MIYGWGGAASFILLLLYLTVKTWSKYLKYRKIDIPLLNLLLGLAVFFLIFIIDQYKINILRTPNFHMIIWIWMGITVSAYNSMKIHGK